LLKTGNVQGALEIMAPAINAQIAGPMTVPVVVPNSLKIENPPRLFVLAIGVSNYSFESIRLNFADRDAEELGKLFDGPAGKDAFSQVRVKPLLNAEATKSKIYEGLRWLKESMKKEDDLGIVFYSGHGDRDSDGIFYILPVGVDPAHLDESAVEGDVFKKKLAGMTGNLVVMLDACHAGQITKGPGGNKQLVPKLEEFAKTMAQEQAGVVWMCSSRGVETSIEDPKLKHGYFTQALKDGLSGKADSNHDGVVKLKELDAYLSDRVEELSKNKQHPVTYNPGSTQVILSKVGN
jgi:uncharacterized caspase-like protein